MAKSPFKLLICMTLAVSAGSASVLTNAASTLRCGSQLISTEDRLFEVQEKCGEPVSQEVLSTGESFNRRYGSAPAVRIEEWVYGPDHGMYQYLRFEGGRLVTIESKRRS